MSALFGPALRMLVSLAVVLALMFVAARLLRRTHGGAPVRTPRVRTPRVRTSTVRAAAKAGGFGALVSSITARGARTPRRPARRRQRLEVLARQPLGKSASVAVVRVAGRTLLVGVTDSSVQLLSEVDAAAFEDSEPAVAAAIATPEPGTWQPNALSIPDTEAALDRAPAFRSSVSVMDVLRERTVRRA